MKLLNFSHPLSTKAAEQLRYFVGEFEEIRIECQIDFDQPIERQLLALVVAGNTAITGEDAVLYIPPALSFAAAYVTKRIGWRPMPEDTIHLRMVVLMASPGPVREFVVADVVDL